jgi:O-antigen/teichoic acid export membrane protein
MTGTTIAQAIPVAISPILTRLYTPEDFGMLALFVAMSTIVGSVASGRYEMAIMLPHSEEEAANILALGMVVTLITTILTIIVIIFFGRQIAHLLQCPDIIPWFYAVPIAVLFSGSYNLLYYFNNRLKYYKKMSQAIITKSVASATVQTTVGFFEGGASGLIIGQIVSMFAGNIKLLKNTLPYLHKITLKHMRIMGKRYIDFPKYATPSALTNTLSIHLTNLLISLFFGIATLGFYTLMQRVLGIPSSIVGSTVSQVFFRQATAEKREKGNAINSFIVVLKKLLLIALPLFILFYIMAEDLFIWMFGNRWGIVGIYAKILIPFFFVSFITASLSVLNSVFEKQRNAFFINLLVLVSSVGCLLYANHISDDFLFFLSLFVKVMTIEHILIFGYYYMLAEGRFSQSKKEKMKVKVIDIAKKRK